MKKEIVLKLKVKNCDVKFRDDFENGILMTEIYEIDVPDEKNSLFTKFLFDLEQKMINDNIEVVMEIK